MSETLALDLTVYLSKETEWLPWETFVSHIDNVLMLFSYSEHYANMKVNSYSIYLVYDTIHLVIYVWLTYHPGKNHGCGSGHSFGYTARSIKVMLGDSFLQTRKI